MYEEILNNTAHRDSPLPDAPWVMMQQWDHLLFRHYPIPCHVLTPYLPPGLQLDTFYGKAWLSIVSFKVSQIRLRKMPLVPFADSSLQINVRTYVMRGNRKGVYFFSLDMNRLLAVLGARVAALSTYFANMSMENRDGVIHFSSERRGKEAGRLKVAYQPSSDIFYAEHERLTNWLLERYFLWTYRNGSLLRGAIHHKRWEIQEADVQTEKQSLTSFLSSHDLGAPLGHYAASQVALIWMLRKER
ncbi:YqjF family protein [Lentibacillus salinarum]|uniref:YqjF family protein n=1 Tax=Lentibacillus salinarum TaxID=446820 RepID=A0ABW3ZSA9_9BACI